MALKFISPSGGRISDATKAIQYALDNGALLSNHSYGAYKDSQTLKNIIKNSQDYNHTYIAAAGNDNKKMSETIEVLLKVIFVCVWIVFFPSL